VFSDPDEGEDVLEFGNTSRRDSRGPVGAFSAFGAGRTRMLVAGGTALAGVALAAGVVVLNTDGHARPLAARAATSANLEVAPMVLAGRPGHTMPALTAAAVLRMKENGTWAILNPSTGAVSVFRGHHCSHGLSGG
jgi:hypothetical protein